MYRQAPTSFFTLQISLEQRLVHTRSVLGSRLFFS